MPAHRLLIAFILLIFNLLPGKNIACGYSFIGECSTGIHLRVNNTLDSFNVSECSFGKTFDGLNLGTIQSLNLAKATAITWESCINNVTSVGLYYRVYEQGMPSGNFNILALPENYNQLEGPYTARYRSQFSNVNLVSGLTAGKTYVLEVYFLAQVDTIGDDFIPETTMVQNNNGHNYKLTFKYGGASAPPFTVVVTQLEHEKCPGDSTGIAGVTVYGNQSGLFYQWSNVNNNFNTLYELTAGTYTVTVSGSNGYTQSQTMMVLQPNPITIAFANVQPVACGSSPGSASAVVNGGTFPFTYLWETGEPDSVAEIPLPGAWGLSVTDANGCTASASVQVGGSTLLQQSLERTICQGSSFTLGGQNFNSAGNFTVQVAGNGTCDTLFLLTISVVNPGDALIGIPEHADLTCSNPTLTLCANILPGIICESKKGGVTLSTSPCLTTNQGGPFEVFATLQQGGQTCTASKTVQVDMHTDAPLVEVSGVANYSDCSSSSATIVLTAQTPAPFPAYTWTMNGNTVSNTNSYAFEVENPHDFTPPGLLVTDAYGCQGTFAGISLVINPAPNAPLVVTNTTPASASTAADGAIELEITDANPPYEIMWENGSTGEALTGLLPGEYCFTVSDAAGCATIGCVDVDFTNGVQNPTGGTIHFYPNPVKAGASLQVIFTENLDERMDAIKLYNLQGQCVWSTRGNSDALLKNIPIPANCSPGTYFLWVKTGKEERFFQLSVF